MHEIAASLEAAGLPPGFHEAAAAVFDRIAAGAPSDLSAVLDVLPCDTLRPGRG